MYKLLLLSLLFINNNYMKQDDLAVKITLEKEKFSTDEEIMLQFEVQNNSDQTLKFCKFNTPFEGFRGIFLQIIHLESNEELSYYGPMVKRIPPQADDYEKLDNKSSTKCSITLNKAYKFEKKGKYSIQFIGENLNDLPDSNIIKFEVQ